MAGNGFLDIPPGAIKYTPPEDYILEKDKNPQWFTDYIRWIISVGYNQKRPVFTQGQINTGGMADEAIENWSYIFAEQSNKTFAYAETDIQGNTIPAVWIPGGKISELFKHIKGRLLEDISNLEISARNLSKDVSSKRSEMLEKLVLKFKLDPILKEAMPDGVEFNPLGKEGEELKSLDQIEKYVTKWQDNYSLIVERMARNLMEFDHLKYKFLGNAQDQIAGGLSAMLTQVVSGRVTNEHVPSWKVIWDNRQDDDFNTEAWFCGTLDSKVPYQKIIQQYGKDFTQEEIKQIRALADPSNMEQAVNWANYYNTSSTGGSPIWWSDWGTANMCISVARVWWIGPRDYRYKQTYDKMGVPRYKKIKDDEDFNYTEDGNPRLLKGSDIPGDFIGYDIHTGLLVGNKYLIRHGYADNVVRPINSRERPSLPMSIYCSDMAMGGNRSIVSRLKRNQQELDRLAYKIQELTAKDNGKVFIINGNKLDVTSTELLSDMKVMGLHVSVGASGEVDNPNERQPMVEMVDMTLDPNIIRYIELRNEQKMEMDEIASVSRISLGQQQNTIGKGVQQNTINQNSYGLASMFYGMMHHFERILQYNVDLQQMLWSFEDTVEESMVIGDEGSMLLKIIDPKEFGTQPMKVAVKLSDFIDSKQKDRIQSVALAAAQNREMSTIDYIENIELAKSPTEMIKGLKHSIEKKERQMMEANKMAQQAQMQHDASLAEQKAINDASLTQLKENSENWRTAVKALQDDIAALTVMLQAVPTASPMLNTLEMINEQQDAAQGQEGAPPMEQQQQTQ